MCSQFWTNLCSYNCYKGNYIKSLFTNCIHFRAITLVPRFIPQFFLVLFINLLEVSLWQFFCSSWTTSSWATCGKQKLQTARIKKVFGKQSGEPNFLKNMISNVGVCLDEWSERETEDEKYISFICFMFVSSHNFITSVCRRTYQLIQHTKRRIWVMYFV